MNEDDKVTKGAVKDAVKEIRKTGRWDLLEETIDKLSAEDIKSREEIERAIDYLEKEANRLGEAGSAVGMLTYRNTAELCRLIIGQEPKIKFWDEEKLFGK